MRVIKNFIDARECDAVGARMLPVFNPTTGEIQAEVATATPTLFENAVRSAQHGFNIWSNTPVSKRAKVMFSFREALSSNIGELAKLISLEHGKVLSDAAGEIERGLEVVEFACGIANHLKGAYSDLASTDIDIYSYREPLGVVAGITPFNFPAMVPMWMFPIAIACGNSFILKPSERDPSASVFMARLFAEAGLPKGVFNVVHGDQEIVNAILTHPGIEAVSFVGSTPVARYIHKTATENRKRVQALGGAKNHAVVMPDADVEYASDHLVASAFGSAGERCMAVSVAVTVGDIHEKIVEAVRAKAQKIKVGDSIDPSSEMGPIVTAAAKERIENLIASGISAGAKPELDGRGYQVNGREKGFFVGPTVLAGVEKDMAVYQEEIFGPVLLIMHVPTLDDALELINSNLYGNGTAIFTQSGEAARTFQRGVKVGMVGINVPIPVPLSHYSFGGWKNSLFGDQHVHGSEGVNFYTRPKVVTSRWPHSLSDSLATYNFPQSN